MSDLVNTAHKIPDLDNPNPIDPQDVANAAWLNNLQGNILKGHGREHTVHVFLKLPADVTAARALIHELSRLVTSAFKQEIERQQYKDYGIPGRLFGNLCLSANGYRKLGAAESELKTAFPETDDDVRNTQSNFLEGMQAHAETDLGDVPVSKWDPGFKEGGIDAMILLADDDEGHLKRRARELLDDIDGRYVIVRIERGTALFNDNKEGIEHFGYVDGRSQPLFLSTDFKDLVNGEIKEGTTEKGGGKVDRWDPSEPLKLVLVRDPFGPADDCLGSFFVFRKLEQNVRDFTIEEQRLADALELGDEERERAGAMTVGRFRDGTPLALSPTDGFIPPKENNFRYDLDDPNALKCPFHAHIRKTNPRGDIGNEDAERSRRVARRGITYGERNRHPNAFQAIDDLPSKDVGLLFMCFQANIRHQFAFLQRAWANNQNFINGNTGIDPIIGQRDHDTPGTPITLIDQTWHQEYGADQPRKQAFFGGFVTMKGGEFFFAPSIPFLRSLTSSPPATPSTPSARSARSTRPTTRATRSPRR